MLKHSLFSSSSAFHENNSQTTVQGQPVVTDLFALAVFQSEVGFFIDRFVVAGQPLNKKSQVPK